MPTTPTPKPAHAHAQADELREAFAKPTVLRRSSGDCALRQKTSSEKSQREALAPARRAASRAASREILLHAKHEKNTFLTRVIGILNEKTQKLNRSTAQQMDSGFCCYLEGKLRRKNARTKCGFRKKLHKSQSSCEKTNINLVYLLFSLLKYKLLQKRERPCKNLRASNRGSPASANQRSECNRTAD